MNLIRSEPVIHLAGVDFVRGNRQILSGIDWCVRRDERWVLLGPNGSGKTTLCRLASLYLHPSRGTIDVLGQRLGKTSVRELRASLGFTSAAVADMLRPTLQVSDIVVSGLYADLAPWWHTYTEADRGRAHELLRQFGCENLEESPFGTLSAGERQRVLLARTLMNKPSLLLLDEPTAGLDLLGRKQLVAMLSKLADDVATPATILVTHHVDEIPRGFTHVLLLADGQVLAAGSIEETLTADALSRCFGVTLRLERRDSRWMVWSD